MNVIISTEVMINDEALLLVKIERQTFVMFQKNSSYVKQNVNMIEPL